MAQVRQAWVARYNNGLPGGTNQAMKMALDLTGNIYVTGFSQNTNENLGYATIKYAPNGNQQWVARFDSNNFSAVSAAMALDINGSVTVTGNALTAKYDKSGNKLWTAPYAANALAVDSGGNVCLAGFPADWAVKLSQADGSVRWLNTYEEPCGPTISQNVLIDQSSNVYVSGLDSYIVAYDNGLEYLYVTLTTIKYDWSGDEIWKVSQNPDPGACISVQVSGAVLDAANNLYIAAKFSDVIGPVIFAYNGSGQAMWTAYWQVNGDPSYPETQTTIDGRNEIFVTGQRIYDPYYYYTTQKLHTNGDVVWMEEYAVESSIGTAIATDAANNCYVTGYAPTENGANSIVTIKYDANGNRVWLQRYTGADNLGAVGNAIAVDTNGDVYVAGYENTPQGGTEMTLIKYAPLIIQQQTNGSVLLQAQGSPGEIFKVQASTNLQTWQDIGSVTADATGVAQFIDTNAPLYDWRYYLTIPRV